MTADFSQGYTYDEQGRLYYGGVMVSNDSFSLVNEDGLLDVTTRVSTLLTYTDSNIPATGGQRSWYYRVRAQNSSYFSLTVNALTAGLLSYVDNPAPEGASYRIALSDGTTFSPVVTAPAQQ